MIVIDASVWISHLLPADINHNTSRAWVQRYIAGGGELIAPVILLVEVGGAVSRRNLQPALGHQAVNQLLALPLLRLVAFNRRSANRAAKLAADLQLRGADALYVEVAQRLGAPLISWDSQQLSRAASLIQVYTPNTAP